jgi:Holliday junction resolvasome RuvABC DNA-binding subunit
VPDVDVIAAVQGNGAPSPLADVRDALGNLGYAPDEIREALRELPAGDDAAALLRDALTVLGARRA